MKRINKECDIINKKGCDSMKMVAHRGYSKYELENTKEAFLAAANRSYYGIETDVHVTTDNHFITIHDDTVNRVTNNTVDLNVERNTFKTIRNIKLADIDGSLTRDDLIIPEMIEYFKVCKKYNKVAVCELKQVFTKEQIQEILDIVDSIGMLDQAKSYTGFTFKEDKTTPTSAEDRRISANGGLVIKLYYDKIDNISYNLNSAYDMLIDIKSS